MAGIALSVVVPARDAAATLRDTLDGLLAQTRGDWEALVVDDGSTDATAELVESYAARDRRFRLLSDGRPSQGASAARNRGIAAATGRWLLFLDADDWLDSRFVEKMVGAAEAGDGREVVYCPYRHVTTDGREGAPTLDARVALAPFETLARACPLVIHSVVLEQALVNEVGCFDEALRVDEDWDLWQRVARTGIAFRPVPQTEVFYRARPNSLSSNVRKRLKDAAIVIERGFAPDPRVSRPASRHADGADPTAGRSKDLVIAYLSLWAAACDIAEKGDGTGLVRPLADRWEDLLETCQLSLIGGLLRGARLLPGDSFDTSEEFLAALRQLLQEVERAANRPGFAQVLEFALEPDILGPRQARDRLVLGKTLFVRQDIRALKPVEAPSGVDTLNIEFRFDGHYLARTETPLFGVLSLRELTEIAIGAVSPSDYFRRSGVLHRPRFWLQFLIASMRLPAHLIGDHPRRGPRSIFRPRHLARRCLVEAAVAASGARPVLSQRQALAAVIDEGQALAAKAKFDSPTKSAAVQGIVQRGGPTSLRLPILAYHRIADDGPATLARYRTTPSAFAAQMAWLHEQSYRPCTSRELALHLHQGRAFAGRPIVITFDDAYQDFQDAAWPVLRAHGFTAEVMVVTDRVGGMADWDADHGAPAPLMDWPEIQALGQAGIQFGSHMASHSHMETLTSRAIALEAAGSRALLERALGRECLSIAAPYGEAVDRFVHIAAQCGYKIGFTVEPGQAGLSDNPLRLPRIEVEGGWSIDNFANALSGGR